MKSLTQQLSSPKIFDQHEVLPIILRNRIKKGVTVRRYRKAEENAYTTQRLYEPRLPRCKLVESDFPAAAALCCGWDEVNAIPHHLERACGDLNSQGMLVCTSERHFVQHT